mmetsp:Transcript_55596/g.144526  ORF Transcript_55596/g.144526 Transcript_55596/m.144526 type:complete len:323 (-) Transcript_55596:222-1190(-)
MLLNFGNVVGHVVYAVHVEILGGLVEDLRERLPGEEGHRRAVHPGVVGGGGHGLHVILALGRLDARASQLPVVSPDVVTGHGALHLHQGVGRDLVAEASAAGVDHDAHLALLIDAHSPGNELVVDLVHHLDLSVVVARPESAELGQTALLGAGGHLVRVRPQHSPVLLAVLLVLWPGIPLAQRPVDAELEGLLHVGGLRRDDAHRTNAHGYVVEERLGELLLHRLHVGEQKVGAHQPHAAIDVETHAARGHDGLRVAHVERCNIADGEAVATVDVWQADGVLADAGQGRDVAYLLDGRQETTDVLRLPSITPELVEHELLQM